MLKRVVGWVGTQLTYWPGHFASVAFLKWDALSGVLYPVYNWCMFASSDIEKWAGIEVHWYESVPLGPQ